MATVSEPRIGHESCDEIVPHIYAVYVEGLTGGECTLQEQLGNMIQGVPHKRIA